MGEVLGLSQDSVGTAGKWGRRPTIATIRPGDPLSGSGHDHGANRRVSGSLVTCYRSGASFCASLVTLMASSAESRKNFLTMPLIDGTAGICRPFTSGIRPKQ